MNNWYGYAIPKFPPTSEFKWRDPKDFVSNKNSSNSSKGCVLEVDLEYPKELNEINNNYPLAPDKIEFQKEILFTFQLKIIDFCNIPIGTVKKLMPNSFSREKYGLHCETYNFT